MENPTFQKIINHIFENYPPSNQEELDRCFFVLDEESSIVLYGGFDDDIGFPMTDFQYFCRLATENVPAIFLIDMMKDCDWVLDNFLEFLRTHPKVVDYNTQIFFKIRRYRPAALKFFKRSFSDSLCYREALKDSQKL